MRVMLDAHPMIRCGAEPLVTFDLLKIRHSKNDQWKRVAKEAGVYPEVYDHAVAAYILKVIEEMGPSAKYLCHKEPVTTPYFKYLAFLFPKSKRRLIVGGKGNETERALRRWETMVKTIMEDCNSIGLDRCITIRYERLVLESELEMKRLFSK
ncbi:Protein-tyrosine sulfotransferase [Paragonimus heterotremus]|uniref:Protein-tyrosine sulfotransferase n=1 Tax=Paragonimus heterotremus TaxID=100268 RepID=A0A8J4T400_9TREM|nr:Protein-tyrosine sulfotransferase [Paragonimus heterotremus]